MTDVSLKWAWNPEDIGGRRLILVQVERTERDSWQCLTDAIQSLSVRPEVVSVKRTPNEHVHTIKFKKHVLTGPVLEGLQGYIETIYEAKCEGAEVEPDTLVWQLSGPVADRLAPKPKERPKTLAKLLETTAGKQLHKLRDEGLRLAIKRLDKSIEASEINEAEAYQLIKMVITGVA